MNFFTVAENIFIFIFVFLGFGFTSFTLRLGFTSFKLGLAVLRLASLRLASLILRSAFFYGSTTHTNLLNIYMQRHVNGNFWASKSAEKNKPT